MALPRIDSPKFELKVPSSGETVEYRPYLVKEEKILMMYLKFGIWIMKKKKV